MLTINDLKYGVIFVYNGQPHQVLEFSHLKKAQSAGMLQIKIKNLITNAVLLTTFKSSDKFEEAKVSRETYQFIYSRRNQFCFIKKDKPQERIFLQQSQVDKAGQYLKANSETQIVFFDGKPINIKLPIKIDFKVTDSPPSDRGNTAQAGTKTAVIETGAKVQVPLFINSGDTIRINTETGEYVERTEKG